MTPYQVVLGQKWKNRTARLRDILPFSQGHASKCVMQLKVIKGKKSFWIDDRVCFYAKKSFSSEKCPKIDIQDFFEQIPVMQYSPKMENFVNDLFLAMVCQKGLRFLRVEDWFNRIFCESHVS